MSDEIQLRQPGEMQIQGNTTFQQTGNGNTQIGYVGQQINNITMGAMPPQFIPVNPNYDYYNLFVIDQEQMDNVLAIPRKHSLDEFTAADVRQMYALPDLAALDEIRRLPSLFVLRNHYGNHTTPDQHAGYGYVLDMKKKGETIVATAHIMHVIRQERLNGLEQELQLLSAPENNELDIVHWAIKKVNLPQLIREKQLIEIMEMQL